MKKITFFAAALLTAVSFGQSFTNGNFDTDIDINNSDPANGWAQDANKKWVMTSGGSGVVQNVFNSNKGYLEQTVTGFSALTSYNLEFDIQLTTDEADKNNNITISVAGDATFDLTSGTQVLNQTNPFTLDGGGTLAVNDVTQRVKLAFTTGATGGDLTFRIKKTQKKTRVAVFDNVEITNEVLSNTKVTKAQVKANAVAYYNMLGQEISAPQEGSGEIVIVKYKSAKGLETIKLVF